MIIGTGLGVLTGFGVSLIRGLIKGVFYSRSLIISSTKNASILKSRSLRRIAKLTGVNLSEAFDRRKPVELEEACATLADKSLIYVMWTGGRPMASQMTRLMATQNFRSGRKILFFDTTQKRKKYDEKLDLKEITDLTIRVSDEGFDKVESILDQIFLRQIPLKEKLNQCFPPMTKFLFVQTIKTRCWVNCA